jgi:hypothetical protein
LGWRNRVGHSLKNNKSNRDCQFSIDR